MLLRLDWNRFTVPINGFLMPLITLVTLVNNALVLAVLLRRQMRTPTNALLAALAVSDTLMSVCPMPCFIHFYTVGQRYLDWVPYSWCFAYFCLTDYLPTVFHTASIWLTTSLAVQRYAHVCCEVDSTIHQKLCTMRGAVCLVVGVYTAAVASQACRFGELTFSAVQVPSAISSTDHVDEDNVTATVEVTACRYEQTPFVARHETVYYNMYYWSRVILIHVIPCTALVILNACLIRTMRAAHQRRRQMSLPRSSLSRRRTDAETEISAAQHEMQVLAPSASYAPAAVAPSPPAQRGGFVGTGSDSSARSTMMLIIVVGVFLLVEVPRHCKTTTVCVILEAEPVPRGATGDWLSLEPQCGFVGTGSDSSARSTMMLIIVVGVFLLVEVPLSVLLLLVIVENTFRVDLFSDATRYTAALIVNCCIAITYPLNFFIYCAMSERFRNMFRALFCRRANVNNAQQPLVPAATARRAARN